MEGEAGFKGHRPFIIVRTSKCGRKALFFDRGIADTASYSLAFGLNADTSMRAGRLFRYNNTVFIAPPWREIFTNDNERTMSFEACFPFHENLVRAYEELGYDLVELPCSDVESRSHFVLERVK